MIRSDSRVNRPPDWPVPTGESRAYYERASRVSPGGVHGEGRTFEPYPLYMTKGSGSRLWDVDGNEYIDYHAGFGAVLLGHNPPEIATAVEDALTTHGPMFATATDVEVELAERIVELVPSAEKVVFSCTGSEATYHAIRLARGVTGREKVLKFEGHYHGWHDYVAWNTHFHSAESPVKDGVARPIPASSGIPAGVEDLVVVCEYNDHEGVRAAIDRHGPELAAMIIEPVFLNAGVIEPAEGFLELCRELCTTHGMILIFDEVITGFRLGLGGAQERLGVTPDVTTLGKAVANGFPLSVVAGHSNLMDAFVPSGSVLFAGTFTGHVVNVCAARRCLDYMVEEPVHEYLEMLGDRLHEGMSAAIEEGGIEAQFRHIGSVWTLYFTKRPIRSYRDVAEFISTKGNELHDRYRRWLLERGIYLHPHYMLRGYLTAAHSVEDVDRLIAATREFLQSGG